MFANIKHSVTVFNEHLFDVCEDSSKCEKRLCLTGTGPYFCGGDPWALLLWEGPWGPTSVWGGVALGPYFY